MTTRKPYALNPFKLLGYPQPTEVHQATCELLGISPLVPRAYHTSSAAIRAAVRTERPSLPNDVPPGVSSRATGAPRTPTTGFSAPR